MVEKELAQVRKANDGFTNVQEMTNLGATVHFIQCDVAQYNLYRRHLPSTQTERIDLVIHGAGVEESKRLEDKDLAGFRRVYFPKVQGALNIINQFLPPSFYRWVLSPDVLGMQDKSIMQPTMLSHIFANNVRTLAHFLVSMGRCRHGSAWWDEAHTYRTRHRFTARRILRDTSRCLVEHRALGRSCHHWSIGRSTIANQSIDAEANCLTSTGVAGYTTLHPNTHKWLLDHAIGDTPVLPG